MEHKKNIPWWLIITMLVFFWPVGLVLMFIKIFGDDEGQKRTTGRKNNGYRMDKSYTDVPFTSSDGEIGATLKPKQLKKMCLFGQYAQLWLAGRIADDLIDRIPDHRCTRPGSDLLGTEHAQKSTALQPLCPPDRRQQRGLPRPFGRRHGRRFR